MKEKYWLLTSKYLSGSITQEEEKVLFTWINQHPDNHRIFEQYVKLWQASAPPAAFVNFNTDHNWQALESRIHQYERTNTRRLRIFQGWMRQISRAAAVFIFCLLAIYLVLNLTDGNSDVFVQSGNEVKAVYLPDSSLVYLNKHSLLTYPKAFEDGVRQVQLSGEALFEVKRNTQKPFIVLASQTKTKVLGTSFNLKTSMEPDVVEIAVLSGKVQFESIQDTTAKVILEKQQAASWNERKGQMQQLATSNPNLLAWRTGKLVFDKTPLKEVIPALESCYGIELQLQGSQAGDCRFTGSFQQAALDEVLESIALSLNIEVQQSNGIYRLEGNGCMAR